MGDTQSSTPPNIGIMARRRTAGDGMESKPITTEPSQRIARAKVQSGLVQVFPTSTIIHKKSGPNTRPKSPKFVPYEPYRAAVRPIVPKASNKTKKITRNNMDINTLITQMSQMNTDLSEFKPRPKLTFVGNKSVDVNLCPEKDEMQRKINKLSQENQVLKEQLKQQAQVNKELKTMLVASMGEDLESQVHCLNEDKKHLANELINSAQHLSTHQEQTEWLAGQCEVWRSKFLASSLMVEELANWKKVLNERTEELRHAMRLLLDERCRARGLQLRTYSNLRSLTTSPRAPPMPPLPPLAPVHHTPSLPLPSSTNILELATLNLKLSESVTCNVEKQEVGGLDALPSMTEAEKYADQIMSLPLELNKVSDEPVSALVSHARGRGGPAPRAQAACHHCSGKVQLL